MYPKMMRKSEIDRRLFTLMCLFLILIVFFLILILMLACVSRMYDPMLNDFSTCSFSVYRCVFSCIYVYYIHTYKTTIVMCMPVCMCERGFSIENPILYTQKMNEDEGKRDRDQYASASVYG